MMHEHRRDQKGEAVVALMITSDTRTPENDETGKTAIKLLEEAGHNVAAYIIVENDASKIAETFNGFAKDERIQVVITSGGTGISSKDITVDTVSPLFEKELPGFGELFRRFSFDEIGEAAMYSRATAGVVGRKLVFCLPGSRGAMKTALNKIILPGLGHMLWEVNR
jgi:molybdenum cofactor biosynthesis protein B